MPFPAEDIPRGNARVEKLEQHWTLLPCSAEDGGSLTMTGTMEYAAPEVLEGESPSEQQETAGYGDVHP